MIYWVVAERWNQRRKEKIYHPEEKEEMELDIFNLIHDGWAVTIKMFKV